MPIGVINCRPPITAGKVWQMNGDDEADGEAVRG